MFATQELATRIERAGSRSQRNVRRHQFQLLYSRAILVKPNEGPSHGEPT